MVRDGPLAVDHDSRLLMETSLARARVVNDDAGNVRMIKHGSNNDMGATMNRETMYARPGFWPLGRLTDTPRERAPVTWE